MTLQTFTVFNQLPPELRRKIWTWSLPRPRLLSYSALQYQPSPNNSIRIMKPAALSVNSESRQLSLHYFSKPIDTRRDFVDFEHDYFWLSSLPETNVLKEQWEPHFAQDDVEKIANVILDYSRFETCRVEFKSTVSNYINHILQSLKGIVIQYHIIEPALRTVAVDLWMSDKLKMTEVESREILAPEKTYVEETLGQIKIAKLQRGEVLCAPGVEVIHCGVCNMCERTAKCRAAQKAWRKKLAKKRAANAVAALAEQEKTENGDLSIAESSKS